MAGAADEDEAGGSARSRRASIPAPRAGSLEQLRMLLAEGRDAQNDETAQSEKARKQNVFPLELIILNPRIQILPVGCFFTRLGGLIF